MIRVVILGFGKVGKQLALAFNKAPDVQLIQIYSRSTHNYREKLKGVEFTERLSNLKQAHIYLIAVPDDFIGQFSNNIPETEGLVVHTSGGADLSVINSKHKRGVFYPLQSFSESGKVNFREIPVCIEAENSQELELLENLGRCISEKVVAINSDERAKLHLAAVFVNNFVNHLYYISNQFLAENQLDFELLKPLISETARKIHTQSPKEAQTGPALRNDLKTLEKHLDLLKNSPYKNLYQQFTAAIKETHGKKL